MEKGGSAPAGNTLCVMSGHPLSPTRGMTDFLEEIYIMWARDSLCQKNLVFKTCS